MVKFVIHDGVSPEPGSLLYRVEEFAFDTEPRPAGAVGSLLINEIELMLDDEGQLLFVTGYSPYHGWNRTSLAAPRSRIGRLRAAVTTIDRGVALPVDGSSRWRVDCDLGNGLIRMTKSVSVAGGHAIRFAPGAVAELYEDRLCAIWLEPVGLAIP